jgi:hypothetical protein
MFKKLSVFVKARIQHLAEEDHSFETSIGLQRAFELPLEVVRFFLLADAHKFQMPHYLAKSSWKYFNGCSTRSCYLREALRKSVRVEALIDWHHRDVLGVWVRFFEKGKKELLQLVFCVQCATGEVSILGSGSSFLLES